MDLKKDLFSSSIKLSVNLISPRELIVRMVNLHDTTTANASLVTADGEIPALTYLSGMRVRGLSGRIEEISLNTIRTKEEVLKSKFELKETGRLNFSSLLVKSKYLMDLRFLTIIIRFSELSNEAI